MKKMKALACLMCIPLLSTFFFVGNARALTPADVTRVSRVTGATPSGETLPNPNRTDVLYQVYGTDLGIMWDKGNNEVFVLFGDTYGEGWGGNGAGPADADWRHNVLAISSDRTPSDGLSFSTMIQDTPGHAKELLSSKRIPLDEETVIPTAGVTVGKRHYIHYMSINHWGPPGRWFTNHSGIAYSDDEGQTWKKDGNVMWINDKTKWDNNFQMAAFVKDGGYVYMFSTRNGRFGNVYLARVPENKMLSMKAYEYWDGKRWKPDPKLAQPVAKGPAGELSVVYNSHFKRWIMVYLNEERHALVMRDSPSVTGPWTGEKILAKSADYPALYGGFIHPFFNDGTELYFNMSQWEPYNVFFMKATLTEDDRGENMITDPGFEDQESNTVSKPWYIEGTGGVDRGIHFSHSGQNNGWLRNTSGWNAMKQTVVVEPNTDYTLTGWIRTSDNMTEGYFGARPPRAGNVLNEVRFGRMDNYTPLKVEFNSGKHSLVEIYAGMWASDGDTWIQIDDITLTKK